MTIEKNICPVCDDGELTPGIYSNDFKHNNGMIHVEGLEYCLCNACGADPVMPEQTRRNHLRIADAKRVQDGLMTGAEIRVIREALGLTQQEASELFGGGANAFSKYERGDVIQSASMDRLLKIAYLCPENLDVLRITVGIELKPVGKMLCGYQESKPVAVANFKPFFYPRKKRPTTNQDWTKLNGKVA